MLPTTRYHSSARLPLVGFLPSCLTSLCEQKRWSERLRDKERTFTHITGGQRVDGCTLSVGVPGAAGETWHVQGTSFWCCAPPPHPIPWLSLKWSVPQCPYAQSLCCSESFVFIQQICNNTWDVAGIGCKGEKDWSSSWWAHSLDFSSGVSKPQPWAISSPTSS